MHFCQTTRPITKFGTLTISDDRPGMVPVRGVRYKTGVIPMDFKAFDTKKIETYAAEAKEKWGKTEAYREYEQRGKQDAGDALMAVFAKIGEIRHLDPTSSEAQAMVKTLQDFISGNYYTFCTSYLS